MTDTSTPLGAAAMREAKALVDRLCEALERLTAPIQDADFGRQMREYNEARAALAAARKWREK